MVKLWRSAINQLFLSSVAVATVVVPSQDRREIFTPTHFVETLDAFVESAVAIESDNGVVHPLKLSFWSIPNAESDQMLLRLRAIVMRFQFPLEAMTMNPHHPVLDGEELGCLGSTDTMAVALTKQTSDLYCSSRCINKGRYCTMEEEGNDKEGLAGADLMLESARRLCVFVACRSKGKEGLFQYFQYVDKLDRIDCSLDNNTCIEHVYQTVGIDREEVDQCIFYSGGAGVDVDSKNAILQAELVRTNKWFSTLEMPYLSLNREPVSNVVDLSDWELLAAVCNAFEFPAPPICDFCLTECPKFNQVHDPTRQCLWDLTCGGDNRTFDDWFQLNQDIGTLADLFEETAIVANTESTPDQSTAAPTSVPSAPQTEMSTADASSVKDLEEEFRHGLAPVSKGSSNGPLLLHALVAVVTLLLW